MRYVRNISLLVLGALLVPSLAGAQTLPPDVCATLRAQRNAITSNPIPSAELAGLLNAAAWTHRADGWGLSAKPSGNNCPRSDGALVACDILQRGETIYDVIAAAGDPGRSEIVCGDGAPAPVGRPWVAPLDPGGTPPPPPPPPPSIDLSPVLDAISQTQADLKALDVKVTAMAVSLEEHRTEARKAIAWAKDWKNWVAVIGAAVAGWVAK